MKAKKGHIQVSKYILLRRKFKTSEFSELDRIGSI